MASDTMALEEFPDSTAITVHDDATDKTASDLAPVFDVPVNISAVLGKAHMSVAQLLKLNRGSVLELDRKVGEAIDIFVNNRLAARSSLSRTGWA
jgi:flagellar motor switch protein FliN/FliY